MVLLHEKVGSCVRCISGEASDEAARVKGDESGMLPRT